ncbi:DLW-39 family protein [Epidermidibacterium keratini]|nr:DLW-39 family protein [Epidermidibacterium keratini]
MLKKILLAAVAAAGIAGYRRQAAAKNEQQLWREATTAPDAKPAK